jgi:hypothetical protein
MLRENNTTVVTTLANLTPHSPVMMPEMRRMWHMLEVYNTRLRLRRIRSAASTWTGSLGRELDRDDWKLNLRFSIYLQSVWGPHSIDRFLSMENTQLTRFNAR